MLGVKEEFEINLKIIRGLGYYTGTVFETILLGNKNYDWFLNKNGAKLPKNNIK